MSKRHGSRRVTATKDNKFIHIVVLLAMNVVNLCARTHIPFLTLSGNERAYLALSGERVQLAQYPNLTERNMQQCDTLRVLITVVGLVPVFNIDNTAAQLFKADRSRNHKTTPMARTWCQQGAVASRRQATPFVCGSTAPNRSQAVSGNTSAKSTSAVITPAILVRPLCQCRQR